MMKYVVDPRVEAIHAVNSVRIAGEPMRADGRLLR